MQGAPVFSAVGAPLPPGVCAAGGGGQGKAGLQFTAAFAHAPPVAAPAHAGPLFAEYLWVGPGGPADVKCASRVLADVARPRPGRPWSADVLPLWSSTSGGGSAAAAGPPVPLPGCLPAPPSTVFLKPRAVYDDPLRPGGVLALCETFAPPRPGSGPALRPTRANTRAPAAVVCDACADADALFTVTQQYTLHESGSGRVIGWPSDTEHRGHHAACSPAAPGRAVADAHLAACARAGLAPAAARAEAAPGQWSFTLGPLPGLAAADALVVARHLLVRIAADAGLVACVDALPAPFTAGGGGPAEVAARLSAAAAAGFAGNGAFFKFSTRATRGGGDSCEAAARARAVPVPGASTASPPLAGPATPPGGAGEGARADGQPAAPPPAAPAPAPSSPAWAALEATVGRLRATHAAHVLVYGPGAAARLALVAGRSDLAAAALLAGAAHRLADSPALSAAIPPFTAGVEDRAASLRIPAAVAAHGRGHVEDRRPAGGCDPYLVVSALLCSGLAGEVAGVLGGAATAAASQAPCLMEAFDESSAEDERPVQEDGWCSDDDEDLYDDDDDDDDVSDSEFGDDADMFDDDDDEDEGGVYEEERRRYAPRPEEEPEVGEEGDSGPRRRRGARASAAAAAAHLPGTPPTWQGAARGAASPSGASSAGVRT